MEKILLLYVPVFHAGYVQLINKYKNEVAAVFVIGDKFIEEFSSRKEIRALDPLVAVRIIDIVFLRDPLSPVFWDLFLLREESNLVLAMEKEIITTRDDVCQYVIKKYLPSQPVIYDTTFLRWDRNSVFSQTTVSYDWASEREFDREMMTLARKEAEKTSDWWRQIGAVLVNKDGVVVSSAYNRHMPSDYEPYFVGDPRDFVKAGERSELASAIHAEQGIIANAARFGTPLMGASLYVNVFPCPVCAKLIAAAGISRLYVADGHASLDGEAVLKDAGVEIILVK